MSNSYKITYREVTIPANGSMQVEINANSFQLKAISGFGYVNNMLIYSSGQIFEVQGREGENVNQSLNITTLGTALIMYIIEKHIENYTKSYQVVFTLITSTTNFNVNCLDVQFYNASGQTVYIDLFPLLSQQSLKFQANPNEKIEQTFYITTGGFPETELWVIQRI